MLAKSYFKNKIDIILVPISLLAPELPPELSAQPDTPIAVVPISSPEPPSRSADRSVPPKMINSAHIPLPCRQHDDHSEHCHIAAVPERPCTLLSPLSACPLSFQLIHRSVSPSSTLHRAGIVIRHVAYSRQQFDVMTLDCGYHTASYRLMKRDLSVARNDAQKSTLTSRHRVRMAPRPCCFSLAYQYPLAPGSSQQRHHVLAVSHTSPGPIEPCHMQGYWAVVLLHDARYRASPAAG